MNKVPIQDDSGKSQRSYICNISNSFNISKTFRIKTTFKREVDPLFKLARIKYLVGEYAT